MSDGQAWADELIGDGIQSTGEAMDESQRERRGVRAIADRLRRSAEQLLALARSLPNGRAKSISIDLFDIVEELERPLPAELNNMPDYSPANQKE